MSRLYTEKIGGKVYGDDMLDYKNYVKISVKVLRKGSSNWVSSQLSTGEAIGTGASILVVILMGWEKSSSLLKDRDLANSLRILFMDEATRLDKDSIRVLRDFAKRMDIQLVLAGPKFEADECGSGFTYRLIRLGYEDGERVIVSGRAGFITQADTEMLPMGAATA